MFLKTLTPSSSIFDDTEQQFWAEDELSHSESLQRLRAKRKRRHRLFYRNRVANRNRFRVFHSSNSSSDSIRTEFLSRGM